MQNIADAAFYSSFPLYGNILIQQWIQYTSAQLQVLKTQNARRRWNLWRKFIRQDNLKSTASEEEKKNNELHSALHTMQPQNILV